MKPFETKREEMLYNIVDYLYDALGPAADEIMAEAELYAVAKMQPSNA